MKLLVLYDPVTKEITGRVKLGNPAHAVNYPDSIEVTEDEFYAEPEIDKAVDNGKLRVRYVYDSLKSEDLPWQR